MESFVNFVLHLMAFASVPAILVVFWWLAGISVPQRDEYHDDWRASL